MIGAFVLLLQQLLLGAHAPLLLPADFITLSLVPGFCSSGLIPNSCMFAFLHLFHDMLIMTLYEGLLPVI